jgi:hypothetical protein
MSRSSSTAGFAMPVLLLAFAAGCSFDEDANPSRGCDENCPPGKCFLNYCLAPLGTVAPPSTSGGAGADPGTPGASGSSAGTGVGSGGNGTSGSDGAGTGGTPPPGCMSTSETCDGRDDDCDGQTDEAIELGSCEAPGNGLCTMGVLRCEDAAEMCVVAAEPSPETCNGLDDDCDGAADEGTDQECYPDDAKGCTARSDGGFDCIGLCHPGKRACEAGELGECTGLVQPAAQETCGGTEAADENCNGQVDDGCPCTGDEVQSCYTGPARTADVGRCRSGEQRCVNGVFGECEGSVVPATERCTNEGVDDDCDRLLDDVFGEGLPCTDPGNLGACRYGLYACSGGSLDCVTREPAAEDNRCDGVDEDCDGPIDETFSFATDESNCGGCGVRCAAGQLCCGSVCRTIASDGQHCGACGAACGAGQTCCGGECVATNTNAHCGGCGGCGAGQACCGGTCVATNTTEHCGGCGGCADGQACCGGQCVATNTVDHCGGCERCAAGLACCGGECVTLDTVAHCGSCSPCAGGEACCGGTCVATGTDDHCAGCAGCEGGQTCCERMCVTPGSPEDICTPPPPACDPLICVSPCSCVGNDCVDSGGLLCL